MATTRSCNAVASFVLLLVIGAARASIAAGAEYYFWNELTGDVQWEDPGDVPFADSTGKRYWIGADGSELDSDPNSLQYKWVEGWSDEHRRHFYYNQETEQSTWERPADLAWRRIEVEAPEEL